MSRNRFILLKRFLHFTDNETDTSDSLYKVRPVLNYILTRFQMMYTPQREIVVLLTAWRDGKKIVRMVTTIHDNKMVQVEEKKKGQKEKVVRLKPECVAQYNRNMAGVDPSRASYPHQLKFLFAVCTSSEIFTRSDLC